MTILHKGGSRRPYNRRIINVERREDGLGECCNSIILLQPRTQFDLNVIKFKELYDIIKKARSVSAPDPNGPYFKNSKVYKNYPTTLCKLEQLNWRQCNICDKGWKGSRRLFNCTRGTFNQIYQVLSQRSEKCAGKVSQPTCSATSTMIHQNKH